MRLITGRHVFAAFTLSFGVIISVNLLLAVQAIRTFPGLEVKNSYVASQAFQKQRHAQEALDWTITATLTGDQLDLQILHNNQPVQPTIQTALFGRATHVGQDQHPTFTFDGTSFRAKVDAGPGNWNLRFSAIAQNGTLFQQRVVIRSAQ